MQKEAVSPHSPTLAMLESPTPIPLPTQKEYSRKPANKKGRSEARNLYSELHPYLKLEVSAKTPLTLQGFFC